MEDDIKKNTPFQFTEGEHHDNKTIVMCHKPAQIDYAARASTDTIYITTFYGADLLNNFQDTYTCKHNWCYV